MDASIRHGIFDSFCSAIGAYASLRHACYCIRSIEGQTKVNDSTLAILIIGPYWDMAKHSSSVVILSHAALESVASRVNLWKPSLLPTQACHQAMFYIDHDTAPLFNPFMQTKPAQLLTLISHHSISKRFMHISNICKNKQQGTNTLTQNYNVRSLYIVMHSKHAKRQNIFSSSLF